MTVVAPGILVGATEEGGSNVAGTFYVLIASAGGATWTEEAFGLCGSASGPGCLPGSTPQSAPLSDGSGHVFGTSFFNGAHGGWVVFEASLSAGGTAPTFRVIYNFCAKQVGDNCTDGAMPVLGWVSKNGRKLYGISEAGGPHAGPQRDGEGTVFELDAGPRGWTHKVLYGFCAQVQGSNCTDGAVPRGGLVVDGAGTVYAITRFGGAHAGPQKSGGGTVFALVPNAAKTVWRHQLLHSFCGQAVGGACRDGLFPTQTMVLDGHGTLYGETNFGGASAVSGSGGGGICADPERRQDRMAPQGAV